MQEEDVSALGDLEKIKQSQIEGVEKEEHYDKSEKFVQAILQWYFSENNQDKKAYLTPRNEKGIITALSINEYLEKHFGIRNEVLDKLCTEKIIKSVAIRGRGNEWIIRFAESFGMQIADSSENEDGLQHKLMRR